MAPGPQKPALKRRFFALVAGAAVVWLGVMLVGGDSGILAIDGARRRHAAVEAKVEALERENARLRREITLLERDEATTERLARERLQMARKDEVVLIVPSPGGEREEPLAPVDKREPDR